MLQRVRSRNSLSLVEVFRHATFFNSYKNIFKKKEYICFQFFIIPIEGTRFLLECTDVESLLVCKLRSIFLRSDPSEYRVNHKF